MRVTEGQAVEHCDHTRLVAALVRKAGNCVQLTAEALREANTLLVEVEHHADGSQTYKVYDD